jgi:hypothetical protein
MPHFLIEVITKSQLQELIVEFGIDNIFVIKYHLMNLVNSGVYTSDQIYSFDDLCPLDVMTKLCQQNYIDKHVMLAVAMYGDLDIIQMSYPQQKEPKYALNILVEYATLNNNLEFLKYASTYLKYKFTNTTMTRAIQTRHLLIIKYLQSLDVSFDGVDLDSVYYLLQSGDYNLNYKSLHGILPSLNVKLKCHMNHT